MTTRSSASPSQETGERALKREIKQRNRGTKTIKTERNRAIESQREARDEKIRESERQRGERLREKKSRESLLLCLQSLSLSSILSPHLTLLCSDLLASGDKEGCLKVWHIRTGKCVKRFDQAHSKAVTCVTFTRDAQKVLTGSFDGTVR